MALILSVPYFLHGQWTQSLASLLSHLCSSLPGAPPASSRNPILVIDTGSSVKSAAAHEPHPPLCCLSSP